MLRMLLLLSLCCMSCVAQTEAKKDAAKEVAAQSEKIFNEKDLSNWQNVYPYGTAKIEGKEIHLTSTGNWFYLTKKKYKDFILEAEVKMPDVKEYSNSGIIFRAQIKKGKKSSSAIGYQAEIDPSSRKWSGGLYDQGRRSWLHPLHKTRSNPDADFKKDLSPEWTKERSEAYKHLEWNRYRIECRGSEIKIFVNDILTTHVIDTKDAEGYIGIQHHGSNELRKKKSTKNVVKFRNIRIQEIK